MRTRSQTRMEF
ncbi:unnamed protein product [Cuscuta epithymum]|nr:unnamed protein product [Cuscuta epithymum]